MSSNKNKTTTTTKKHEDVERVEVSKGDPVNEKAPTFSLEKFMDIKGLKSAERLFCKRHFRNVKEEKTIDDWMVLCHKHGLEF